MEFRIYKTGNKYMIYYKDDFDNGGSWNRVIWDKDNYRHFVDTNFTDSIEEAMERASEFKLNYEKEHGSLIKEFKL